MRKLSLALLLSLPALAAPAAPPAKIKDEPAVAIRGVLKVPPYGLADLDGFVKDASESTRYRWKVVRGEPAAVVTLGRRLIFSGPPGKYTVRLLVVDFDRKVFDEVEAEVVLGGGVPPAPPPPPPDLLAAALRAAYQQGPQDRAALLGLVSLYRSSAGKVDDPRLKTWGDLFVGMKAVAKEVGVTGKLPQVQAAVSAELIRSLPVNPVSTPGAPLDDAGRALARDAFARIARALEEVARP